MCFYQLLGEGEVVQVRQYVGLVDAAGAPTAAWTASRRLNRRLGSLSAALAGRTFRGGYEARRAPADEPLASHEKDLDLAFFGGVEGTSHVLVVNRRTTAARTVELEVGNGIRFADVENGEVIEGSVVTVLLEAGGFRLLEVMR